MQKTSQIWNQPDGKHWCFQFWIWKKTRKENHQFKWPHFQAAHHDNGLKKLETALVSQKELKSAMLKKITKL